MKKVISRLAVVVLLTSLAACAAPPKEVVEVPQVVAGYEAVQDGEFFIEAVKPLHMTPETIKAEVAYAGKEKPGAIVVDTHARKLYYILEGGRAIRYGIAVGREGIGFSGDGTIQRKQEWPSWQPTANMIRTRPDLYAKYAAGLPGGLDNPLGARAMYLYRGGRDTMFRIHGTIDNASIGRATSAGCIRLFNQDAIDLYNRVKMGTRVHVRTLAESLEMEGPYMDDAYGRAVPATDANKAQFEKDLVTIAEREKREAAEKAAEEARLALEAEKAEKRRLRVCRNKGIAVADCPPLDPTGV